MFQKLLILAALFVPPVVIAEQPVRDTPAVNREITLALEKFSNFKLLKIGNKTGTINVDPSIGLTVEDLRGIELDDRPPKLARQISYGRQFVDNSPRGRAPYVAKNIKPFRLDHFNCEFNYGGHHNNLMQDYASLHGFNTIALYRRTKVQQDVFPPGTRISKWKGISAYRTKWFKEKQIPSGRYDLLDDSHFQISATPSNPQENRQLAHLMLDMEHAVLPPQRLVKQKWYPRTNTEQFAKKYYLNYAKTITSFVDAYHRVGFQNIGIYGWQPFHKAWVPMIRNLPLPRDGWEAFGKRIYQHVDVIHNSVYCPYSSGRNVAYVLASIEENVHRVDEMPIKKPIRPYFWPLISGGGKGDRWWREIPHPNEDQLAMIAMSFFTGTDGIVIWNWSGTSSHHKPSSDSFNGKKNKGFHTVMVGKPFRMSKADGSFEIFQRYDCLHVTNVGNGSMSFQKIDPAAKKTNYGISPNSYTFNANSAALRNYLRPRSEPISAVVEGLALIKPFEYSLKTGTPKIDHDAPTDFRKYNPLLRRVVNGNYHLVITYDPRSFRTGEKRPVKVQNFAGRDGLDLIFPADEHPRIFVVANK